MRMPQYDSSENEEVFKSVSKFAGLVSSVSQQGCCHLSIFPATSTTLELFGNSGLEPDHFGSEHVKTKEDRVCIQDLVWPKYKPSIFTEAHL